MQTDDKCGMFTELKGEWKAGDEYFDGSYSGDNGPAQKILRAFDIHTGKPVWELPQVGSLGESFGGVISTATGVVLFGADNGAVEAADATTGKLLWSFQTNALLKASPITYVFDHKQYVAIAAGPNIISFSLPETPQPKK